MLDGVQTAVWFLTATIRPVPGIGTRDCDRVRDQAIGEGKQQEQQKSQQLFL